MKMVKVYFVKCVVALIATVCCLELNNTKQSPNSGNRSMRSLNLELRRDAFYLILPPSVEEDALLTTPELIKKYGYPAETHSVITEDEYILQIHRIRNGKKLRPRKRPVMLVQHGLLASSADWVLTGPGKGLGYVLADAGFDVWMVNSRGSRYSRNHTFLDPDSAGFWQFSWHELGVYDLPAAIDYVLGQTKQEKLFYVGHSQGTTSFYVLCSEKPEYNNKIHIQFSLAPIAYMGHVTSPFLRTTALLSGAALTGAIGVNEFNPASQSLQAKSANFLCSNESMTQVLCSNIYFALFGYNAKQMNASVLPIILSHSPAGASVKQFVHYGQEIQSGRFEYFDYGLIENVLQYGFATPPQYDLSNVKAPVYLFYSRNDVMSHEIDVLQLCREIENCKEKILITDAQFSHVDYLYAIDAPELVYKKVIAIAIAAHHKK